MTHRGVDPVRLAEQLAAGEIDAAALSWFQAGMRAFLLGHAGLEQALNLTNVHRVVARNRALLHADALLTAGAVLSPWARAGRLAEALAWFGETTWPRLRAGEDITLSELERALADTLRSGARRLATQRRIYDLLRD